MAQTNKINVYRIKDPSIPDSELVKNYQDYRPLSHPEESNNWNLEQLQIESVAYYIPIDNIGSVYVKQSREAKTRWCSSFFLDTIQLYSRSMGASLIVRITVDDAPETYAITFGHVGRFIIDPEMYDDRFGIKTALSAIDSNRLKQIVKNEFTGSNRITQQQISNGANMSGFEVNPFGDYLKSVTGDVIDSSVSKAAIKGSAALTLTLEVNIENIVATLEEITRLYRSNAYKENYEWIDNLYLVQDSKLSQALFEKAIDHANKRDGTIWLAVPDLVDYDLVGSFRYLGSEHNDIELTEYLEAKGDSISVEDLDKYISARSVEDDKELKRWQLKKCICGEVELNGELYGASDGKWFHIEKDYAQRIDRAYSEVDVYSKTLSAFSKVKDTSKINKDGEAKTIYSEGAYLERITKENPDEFVLLDQDLVKGIEVCDLVTRDALIHVKRYKGSSAMSHAFFQGLNSATMLQNDSEYLTEANKKILTINPDAKFQIGKPDEKDIVFAIIGKDSSQRPHLPLFSKISLFHTLVRLTGLGYSCKIAAIQIEE